jgi:hypothetical protein
VVFKTSAPAPKWQLVHSARRYGQAACRHDRPDRRRGRRPGATESPRHLITTPPGRPFLRHQPTAGWHQIPRGSHHALDASAGRMHLPSHLRRRARILSRPAAQALTISLASARRDATAPSAGGLPRRPAPAAGTRGPRPAIHGSSTSSGRPARGLVGSDVLVTPSRDGLHHVHLGDLASCAASPGLQSHGARDSPPDAPSPDGGARRRHGRPGARSIAWRPTLTRHCRHAGPSAESFPPCSNRAWLISRARRAGWSFHQGRADDPGQVRLAARCPCRAEGSWGVETRNDDAIGRASIGARGCYAGAAPPIVVRCIRRRWGMS